MSDTDTAESAGPSQGPEVETDTDPTEAELRREWVVRCGKWSQADYFDATPYFEAVGTVKVGRDPKPTCMGCGHTSLAVEYHPICPACAHVNGLTLCLTPDQRQGCEFCRHQSEERVRLRAEQVSEYLCREPSVIYSRYRRQKRSRAKAIERACTSQGRPLQGALPRRPERVRPGSSQRSADATSRLISSDTSAPATPSEPRRRAPTASARRRNQPSSSSFRQPTESGRSPAASTTTAAAAAEELEVWLSEADEEAGTIRQVQTVPFPVGGLYSASSLQSVVTTADDDFPLSVLRLPDRSPTATPAASHNEQLAQATVRQLSGQGETLEVIPATASQDVASGQDQLNRALARAAGSCTVAGSIAAALSPATHVALPTATPSYLPSAASGRDDLVRYPSPGPDEDDFGNVEADPEAGRIELPAHSPFPLRLTSEAVDIGRATLACRTTMSPTGPSNSSDDDLPLVRLRLSSAQQSGSEAATERKAATADDSPPSPPSRRTRSRQEVRGSSSALATTETASDPDDIVEVVYTRGSDTGHSAVPHQGSQTTGDLTTATSDFEAALRSADDAPPKAPATKKKRRMKVKKTPSVLPPPQHRLVRELAAAPGTVRITSPPPAATFTTREGEAPPATSGADSPQPAATSRRPTAVTTVMSRRRPTLSRVARPASTSRTSRPRSPTRPWRGLTSTGASRSRVKRIPRRQPPASGQNHEPRYVTCTNASGVKIQYSCRTEVAFRHQAGLTEAEKDNRVRLVVVARDVLRRLARRAGRDMSTTAGERVLLFLVLHLYTRGESPPSAFWEANYSGMLQRLILELPEVEDTARTRRRALEHLDRHLFLGRRSAGNEPNLDPTSPPTDVRLSANTIDDRASLEHVYQSGIKRRTSASPRPRKVQRSKGQHVSEGVGGSEYTRRLAGHFTPGASTPRSQSVPGLTLATGKSEQRRLRRHRALARRISQSLSSPSRRSRSAPLTPAQQRAEVDLRAGLSPVLSVNLERLPASTLSSFNVSPRGVSPPAVQAQLLDTAVVVQTDVREVSTQSRGLQTQQQMSSVAIQATVAATPRVVEVPCRLQRRLPDQVPFAEPVPTPLLRTRTNTGAALLYNAMEACAEMPTAASLQPINDAGGARLAYDQRWSQRRLPFVEAIDPDIVTIIDERHREVADVIAANTSADGDLPALTSSAFLRNIIDDGPYTDEPQPPVHRGVLPVRVDDRVSVRSGVTPSTPITLDQSAVDIWEANTSETLHSLSGILQLLNHGEHLFRNRDYWLALNRLVERAVRPTSDSYVTLVAARRANTLPAGLNREQRVERMSAPITNVPALHFALGEPPADVEPQASAADAGPEDEDTTEQ